MVRTPEELVDEIFFNYGEHFEMIPDEKWPENLAAILVKRSLDQELEIAYLKSRIRIYEIQAQKPPRDTTWT